MALFVLDVDLGDRVSLPPFCIPDAADFCDFWAAKWSIRTFSDFPSSFQSLHDHMDLSNQKLLIANRGEIALRILRTAHRLKLPTIAVYTPADATSPHVSIASEAVALPENLSYLDPDLLVRVAKEHGATLLHPGYGFLSENAEFARAVEDAGITWLGPSAEIIGRMGLKHEARRIAEAAGVPVVLGTGLLANVDEAIEAAESIGWPVMLKSTAGGGGMGLVICRNATEMKAKFEATQGRAKVYVLLPDSDPSSLMYISSHCSRTKAFSSSATFLHRATSKYRHVASSFLLFGLFILNPGLWRRAGTCDPHGRTRVQRAAPTPEGHRRVTQPFHARPSR